MDFIKWLKSEREKRGISQRGLAQMAVDAEGKKMASSVISRMEKRERGCTAESAIRIARALRIEFLQVLYLAGYIRKNEVSLAKKFIPDNPQLYRIWSALKGLDDEQLELCEKPVLAIVEACAAKGGDEGKEARANPG